MLKNINKEMLQQSLQRMYASMKTDGKNQT